MNAFHSKFRIIRVMKTQATRANSFKILGHSFYEKLDAGKNRYSDMKSSKPFTFDIVKSIMFTFVST